MTVLTAKPFTARPLTARPFTAYPFGESTSVSRWYLHWAGVNEYAKHSTWNMSGFGDVVSETITPAAPGTGDQYLWANSDASWGLYIDDSTGDLILDYVDVDGSTARTITGPALSAGETVSYSIEFAADGVTMTVGATDYTNANTPELGSIVYLSANNTPASYFQGTRENLRYTNATALQGVNAVMGNGVDLYGTIPTVTLAGDFEIEFWWRRQDRTGTDSQRLLQNPEDDFDAGIAVFDSANPTSPDALRVENDAGVFSTLGNAFINIAQGQDVHVQVSRSGDVLSAVLDEVDAGAFAGPLTGSITLGIIGKTPVSSYPTNSTIQNLKITDKSGASDVVCQYDLSGDDGSDIPITIDGVASTPGTWQNYDSGVDQVALPKLSRHYEIKDGPGATHLADSNGADATGAELFNVGESDWDRSKT